LGLVGSEGLLSVQREVGQAIRVRTDPRSPILGLARETS